LNRKRNSGDSVANETDDDDKKQPVADSTGSTPQSEVKSAVKKINSKGLAVLKNGVVAKRELELCAERPGPRNPGTLS
jgi:hypothetical protein